MQLALAGQASRVDGIGDESPNPITKNGFQRRAFGASRMGCLPGDSCFCRPVKNRTNDKNHAILGFETIGKDCLDDENIWPEKL